MNEPDDPVSPSSEIGHLTRDERRIRAAQDVLRTTIRDLFTGHFRMEPPSGVLDLHVTLRVQPAANWKVEFHPPLLDQVMPQLAGREAARDAITVGHVYCFRCSSSRCEHAVAPTPLHVFKHYDPAGRPEWQEFVQVLIDEKDERADQLFAKPAKLVAHFQFGRALKGRQLATFGKASLSYSILAQVVAGYFEHAGERLAVTLQVVEGRDPQGEVVVRLNPIGHGLDGSLLLEWLSAPKSAALFRAIQIAERELAGIEQIVRAARSSHDQHRANQYMGRIPGVARRLAETIERGGRQGERRTRHVEERRHDQRPVHKALEDAATAKQEACFFDEKSKTFIVVGDRGRTHAFSPAGRHVTSFIVKPSAVAFRIRTERWRPVQAHEWANVQQSLQRRAVHGAASHDQEIH